MDVSTEDTNEPDMSFIYTQEELVDANTAEEPIPPIVSRDELIDVDPVEEPAPHQPPFSFEQMRDDCGFAPRSKSPEPFIIMNTRNLEEEFSIC